VLRLGLPERPRRRDFGDDVSRPQAGGLDIGDGVLGFLSLVTVPGDAVDVDDPASLRRFVDEFGVAGLR
jgi:hypothetical protein